MNLLKYGIYVIIIVIIALLFEQTMIFLYDITRQGFTGNIVAYCYIMIFWICLYIISRMFLDKSINSKSSQYVLYGGMFHIGLCLGIYFYDTEPLLLLIFPMLFGIGFWTRQTRPILMKKQLHLNQIHPEFIDDRGGMCVLRSGMQGFTALKFFAIQPPIPVREFLLYLFYEQIEGVFEIQRSDNQFSYFLTIVTRGRRYDQLYRNCLEQSIRLRQFFLQEQIRFMELNDMLNVLRAFYQPYFLYTPSPLNNRGVPLQFPHLIPIEMELVIEDSYDRKNFTLHTLQPKFIQNELYAILENVKEEYYLQIHFRPLTPLEIAEQEARLNQKYRDSLKRLTKDLDEDMEFQAASYLFSSVGQVSKENLEPLLDQDELAHLKEVKRQMRHIKVGTQIGLWELEICLLGNSVLAQTVAVKLGGHQQQHIPQAFTSLVSREFIGISQIVNSKELAILLPIPPIRTETDIQEIND
ncbi:MAG: hypothetical protein ACTSYB_01470 [Candidatus Helarchaeota archaeon]